MANLLMRLLPFSSRTSPANEFVTQFQKIAAHAISATEQVKSALNGAPDDALARILDIEHSADDAVREIHCLVDGVFITPYDKRDIINLAHRLDNVVDAMRTVLRLLVSYRVLEGNDTGLVTRATAMCDLILRSATALKEIVDEMPALDHDRLREALRVIDSIEHEGDELFIEAIRTIFPHPNQTLTAAMLAWRDIFRLLERATDHCGHAMGVIISIARQEGS